MSVDVCKVCDRNTTELHPIGTKRYYGIDIPQIICNLLQVNSELILGDSFICVSCITTLHLINGKIEDLRRAFAPPANQQVHSDFGSSTPNKSNSAKSKPVPEIGQTQGSVNVETPKKTAISNKNTLTESLSKGTPNAKNSAETVQEIVVAKKTPTIKKSTLGEVKINAKNKQKKQGKIVSSTGIESSLTIDEEHSSSEQKEKKIPKRRNTIYHFDCEFCDFQTGIIKVMQQHLVDNHDVKAPRIFECKQCLTKYTTKQGLDVHNKRHHPENGVETGKNATSQDVVEEEGEKVVLTKETSPVKKIVSAKSPVKTATPEVRPSPQKLKTTSDTKKEPQKLKTPSDIKKGLNFNSSDDIVSPQNPSPLLKPVSTQLYKCDECSTVCDSTFRLDLHRSLKHCFITNQSGCESVQNSDDDDDYNETTLGISNGLNGSNRNDQEVPETDSDLDKVQQVIPSPKKSPVKLPKTSISETTVPGVSSVSPPKAKSKFNTKCEFCAILFDSPKNYANHLTNQHGIEEPRVFKCTQCGKTYKTQAVLRRHIKNVHEKIKIDDIIASDSANEKDNNESKADSDIEVSCYEANQTLQEHDDNASNSSMEFPFQIAKINALPARTSLDQGSADELVKTNKQNVTCPQCDQELDSLSSLKKHLKVEHSGSDEAIFVCDLCPAKYKHNKNLKRHKDKHHSSNGNEDLATDTDNLIVSDADNGSHKHIKKQKKTKVSSPAKNNSFNDDAETETISSKKRTRENSKSETSPTKSPKKAKYSVSFQEDQLDVLDSNPPPQKLSCSECNKSFKSVGKLERHNKKHHTAEQIELFSCKVGSCHKQFNEQKFLDMHIQKKHPGEAF